MPRMFRLHIDIETEIETDCVEMRDDLAVWIQEQGYELAEGSISEVEGKKIVEIEYFRLE